MRSWLADLAVATLFIEPDSPWENGYLESFNGKPRHKPLNGELFFTLKEAQILIEQWRLEYNHLRPHSWGKKDRLVGKLQQKYGFASDEAGVRTSGRSSRMRSSFNLKAAKSSGDSDGGGRRLPVRRRGSLTGAPRRPRCPPR